MKRNTALRRVPLQSRSRERLERILDAGEQELAQVGYDAATMQAIADRAGTSIGSVYQFFPNKKALFDAIFTRYMAQVRALFDGLLTPENAALPWPDLLDLAIDTCHEFTTRAPGFRAIWLQSSISPELLDTSDALNDEMAERIALLLAAYAKGLGRKELPVVATVIVETISVMIFVAGRRGEPMASQILNETKVLLRRYVAGYEHPKKGKDRSRSP